jgi:excisionase family DNA binding protein
MAPGAVGFATKQEAAEIWRVSVRTVDRLIAAGRIPFGRIGKSVRLRLSDVLAFPAMDANFTSPKA